MGAAHRRLVRTLRQGFAHLCLSIGEHQNEVGLAVREEIGRLPGAIVVIDRDDADPDCVQRQLVQHVVRAVLE